MFDGSYIPPTNLRSQKDLYEQIRNKTGILDGIESLDVEPVMPEAQNKENDPIETFLNTNGKGLYIDPYRLNAGVVYDAKKKIESKKDNSDFKKNTQCDLTDNELLTFRLIYTLWTGMDAEGISDDGTTYEDFNYDEMMEQLMNVKAFCRNELNRTFGLTGAMAQINQAMFMADLDEFNEEELMAYAVLFHMDLAALEDMQTLLDEQYRVFMEQEDTNQAALEQRQEENEKIYLKTLKSIIMEFRIAMLDRLRLWRWREEVLLGGVAHQLEDYPGVPIIYNFESAEELQENGILSYYFRVGSVKREELMDRYSYLELYHMAGILASGFHKEVEFDTTMKFEDLADTIMTMLEDMQIDPRHILTPLGVQIIHNSEKGEAVYNLSPHQFHDIEDLYLACTQAGVEVFKETTVVRDADSLLYSELVEFKESGLLRSNVVEESRRRYKPQYVLLEELASQYLSPQFFSAVESYRYYLAAVESLYTLSGEKIIYAEDSQLIFYGIGDGISRYRVYTPRELADCFKLYADFIDPYSVRSHPLMPAKWSRFSLQSITRLVRLVIPRLRVLSKDDGKIRNVAETYREEESMRGNIIPQVQNPINSQSQTTEYGLPENDGYVIRKDLDDLEEAISYIMGIVDIENPETADIYFKPRAEQKRIVNVLTHNSDKIKIRLASFLSYLFQVGVQLSDWSTYMTQIDQNSIQMGRAFDPQWKHIDPETVSGLTSKIFSMLTVEMQKYMKVRTDDRDDYTDLVKKLRLVKHYLGAYRIDWNDELATIEGHIELMVRANDLSLYDHLRTSGNWLMSTANYYAMELLGTPLVSDEVEITETPYTPEQLITV